MTLATAVTKKSWPTSISAVAKLWPGLSAGTRLPYPVVVRVVKEKNRSCGNDPSPCAPKKGPVWFAAADRYTKAKNMPIRRYVAKAPRTVSKSITDRRIRCRPMAKGATRYSKLLTGGRKRPGMPCCRKSPRTAAGIAMSRAAPAKRRTERDASEVRKSNPHRRDLDR